MNGQRLVSVSLMFQNYMIKLTIPIALLFTFYLPQSFIIYPFLFYYMFSFFIYRYVTNIENHFQIMNKKQTTRLFPEESGQLSIMLQNKARLPLVNGKCFFHVNPSLVTHRPVERPESQIHSPVSRVLPNVKNIDKTLF